MPLQPFKDEEGSDHDVGMSISPAPSPHTTLTPIEAAELSAQTKEAVNDVKAVADPLSVEGEAALSPRATDIDTILTPGTLNMSGVVSQENVMANLENTEQTKEQKLEARIAQLEQNIASLMDVCNGLVRQQQVRNECLDAQNHPGQLFVGE